MGFELACGHAVENGLGRLVCRDERGHLEIILVGERGFDEAGIDEVHGHALGREIEIQRFGQIDQCGLGGPVDQPGGQPAIAGHAGGERDPPAAAFGKPGCNQGHRVQGPDEVDLHQLRGGVRLQFPGPHGLMGAGIDEHHVESAECGNHRCVGGSQRRGIGDVGRCHVGCVQVFQRGRLAAGDRHPCAQVDETLRQRFAYAGTGTDEPDPLTAPVGQRAIQAHEPLRNDSTISPSLNPNLRMSDLFSITLSSIKYIQSSNCTS